MTLSLLVSVIISVKSVRSWRSLCSGSNAKQSRTSQLFSAMKQPPPRGVPARLRLIVDQERGKTDSKKKKRDPLLESLLLKVPSPPIRHTHTHIAPRPKFNRNQRAHFSELLNVKGGDALSINDRKHKSKPPNSQQINPSVDRIRNLFDSDTLEKLQSQLADAEILRNYMNHAEILRNGDYFVDYTQAERLKKKAALEFQQKIKENADVQRKVAQYRFPVEKSHLMLAASVTNIFEKLPCDGTFESDVISKPGQPDVYKVFAEHFVLNMASSPRNIKNRKFIKSGQFDI